MKIATAETQQELEYYLPNHITTARLAQFFSIFSDNTRVRMLSALAISPLCVGDLAEILQVNQTTISHQLKIMRDLGVVKYVRSGKVLRYSICNNKINEILLIGVEYLGY